MLLETPRLILRPWQMTDLEDLYTLAKNPHVGPRAGWRPHQSREESRLILSRMITAPDVFAIVLRQNDKVIGMISAGVDSSRRNLAAKSIGCALNEDYWNHGYMSEAVNRMIQYLFADPGTELIAMDHFTDNPGSRRVIEKNGFQYEGTMRQKFRLFNGEVKDCLCYSLTRAEFEAQTVSKDKD
ncbi:GNAT family N-acetyltransferase [Holdemania massiliensis]|uniref:GNAT family N-acetyltransferase n=1 Tax=Holdemania massiliensis TaxID=1468449 RepID=UPI001F064D81|nr:GNAT family protein [Holdemania massiliensis]MCH1940173.1 GNAT family N-acetyltransferase [Holdemania massiliensis]